MKICSLVLLTLLLAAPWTGSQGFSFRTTGGCCTKDMFFKGKKLKASNIMNYWNTSSACPHKAVKVEVPQGIFCVNPNSKEFQRYLKKTKKQTSL